MIHPTAIIDSKADIDSNVDVGPHSIVEANVQIGSGTVIGPHVVIQPHVEIGPDCHIFQFASIGAVPQALKFQGEETYVKIGRGTVIREFVTVNRGTGFGGEITAKPGEKLF
jgi:UDP-N-acetylglucosamine acyltransferase